MPQNIDPQAQPEPRDLTAGPFVIRRNGAHVHIRWEANYGDITGHIFKPDELDALQHIIDTARSQGAPPMGDSTPRS